MANFHYDWSMFPRVQQTINISLKKTEPMFDGAYMRHSVATSFTSECFLSYDLPYGH